MSKTYEKSNEALAILAQRGCEVVREKARDLLLRRNEGLIYDKALTYWNYVIGSDIDRSLAHAGRSGAARPHQVLRNACCV